MTVDVHFVCQGALNNYNSVSGQIDAMMVPYERDLAEFQSDMQDVAEICGGAEDALEELSADGALVHELYNNPVGDTITIPRFWHDLLDALADKAGLGIGCLFELAGALTSESTFRNTEKNLNDLYKNLEIFRRAYVGCLREAGLQKARRDGAVPPPL